MIHRLLLVASFVTVALTGAAPGAALAAQVRAFASVVPVQGFVERIGGERVEVGAMVRPGENPHVYEPTPRQMAALARADIFFRVGMPFEDVWMDRIRAANPGMTVVDLREGIRLKAMAGHDADGPDGHGHDDEHENGSGDTAHGHSGMDPHIWTDPRNVMVMAERIRDALSRLDAAGADVYGTGLRAFREELEALDADLRELLSGLEGHRFLVYHPAWGYFAEAYGLEQVPVEIEGKEPGPRTLGRVIERARQDDIRVIFVQPQVSRRSAEAVARAIDGRVVTVDPLAADYAGNMRRVAGAFAETVR